MCTEYGLGGTEKLSLYRMVRFSEESLKEKRPNWLTLLYRMHHNRDICCCKLRYLAVDYLELSTASEGTPVH
jgi:hypothetical protein